jgi:hypothetical protein
MISLIMDDASDAMDATEEEFIEAAAPRRSVDENIVENDGGALRNRLQRSATSFLPGCGDHLELSNALLEQIKTGVKNGRAANGKRIALDLARFR